MIRGVLFDKDGTLFDFEATWCTWAAELLAGLAQGDAGRAASLGRRIGFDLAARQFAPDSPAIAGTPDEVALILSPGVPELTLKALTARINDTAARAPQVPVVPLEPLLGRLRAMRLRLGVATNDAEAPAMAHLAGAGQAEAFDFIAGSDSGHGAKPGPGQCLAFAKAVGLEPSEVLMVGDSAHDLHAGRGAGMRCAAVLTGYAARDVLAPLADIVLRDISDLPDWILSQNET